MTLSDKEREIIRFVVSRFLNLNQSTARKDLLGKFRSSSMINGLCPPYLLALGDTYLPTCLSIQECADAGGLEFAKTSAGIVLRALQNLYEVEPAGTANRDFTFGELKDHIIKMYDSVNPSGVVIGLFLAHEFGFITHFSMDARREITSFGIGESILEISDFDGEWDRQVARLKPASGPVLTPPASEAEVVQSRLKTLEELLRERSELDSQLQRYRQPIAVVFADIADSTSFYERRGDLEGAAMVQEFKNLFQPARDRHGGTLVKTMGDGLLIRFEDAQEAVGSAIEMQKALAQRNSERAIDDHIRSRIVVHLGQAILSKDDVLGDVVNVAARMEKAAQPGEIVISRPVYEAVRQMSDIRVQEKATGVEFKGKSEKVDLYTVIWTEKV